MPIFSPSSLECFPLPKCPPRRSSTQQRRQPCKVDAVQRDQERTANALRQAIHALDAELVQTLAGLQSRYWGTLVVILVDFVTALFARAQSGVFPEPPPRGRRWQCGSAMP